MIDIVEATTAQEALTHLDGNPKFISTCPAAELQDRAGDLTEGAFDFCGTLVTGSQWRSLEALLPPESQQRGTDNINWIQEHRNGRLLEGGSLEDPDWFLGHIHPGNLDAADAALALIPIMLAEMAGVTIKAVEAAGAALPMREGADHLLNLFKDRTIVSFGIEQMIYAWLKQHDIKMTAVATRLGEDDEGRVQGCLLNMVIASTKPLVVDRFRAITGSSPAQTLIIGDTIFDVDMMQEGTFNILIIPPAEADKRLAGFRNGTLSHMWPKLTAILYSDSLMPLVELIELERGRS